MDADESGKERRGDQRQRQPASDEAPWHVVDVGDPRLRHGDERQREGDRARGDERDKRSSDHARTGLRAPYQTSRRTIATAGISRRYAPTYQSGVVGMKEGSQPRGFTPSATSKRSWSCCWNASLSARAGIAERRNAANALIAMSRPTTTRIHQSRAAASPYATNGAASGRTSTR